MIKSWENVKKYGKPSDERIKLMNEENEYKSCKYNTSKSSSFVGYCNHPQYYEDWGHFLVECCKFPCKNYDTSIKR